MSDQAEFARGYVRALASAAGLHVSAHHVDRDGVDLGFRFPARVSPTIEALVAWCDRPRADGGAWCFDGLDEERFNRLAGDRFTVPRYLFLLVLPQDRAYTNLVSDGMFLRHLAYHVSLRDEQPIERPDRARCRRVRVPVGQVLTVPALLKLVRE